MNQADPGNKDGISDETRRAKAAALNHDVSQEGERQQDDAVLAMKSAIAAKDENPDEC